MIPRSWLVDAARQSPRLTLAFWLVVAALRGMAWRAGIGWEVPVE